MADDNDFRGLLRSRLEEAGARIRLSTEIRILQDELQVLRTQNAALRAENAEVHAEADGAQFMLTQVGRERDRAVEENAELRAQIGVLDTVRASRNETVDSLTAHVAALKTRLEAAEAEIIVLRTQLSGVT